MKKARPLNDKELRFCQQLALGVTGIDAVRAAGYVGTANYLKTYACKLQKRAGIQKYLAELRAKSEADAVAKLDELRKQLTEDIRFDYGVVLTDEGMLDPTKLKRMGKRIKAIAISAAGGVRVEFNDRHAAIDRLAKIEGFYRPEKVEHSGTVETDLSGLTTGQLEKLLKQLDEK